MEQGREIDNELGSNVDTSMDKNKDFSNKDTRASSVGVGNMESRSEGISESFNKD